MHIGCSPERRNFRSRYFGFLVVDLVVEKSSTYRDKSRNHGAHYRDNPFEIAKLADEACFLAADAPAQAKRSGQ
jgi:hypothetical protein